MLSRFFITNRFDSNIHRGKPNIKKHGICVVAVVQVLYVLVEELEQSRTQNVAGVQFDECSVHVIEAEPELGRKAFDDIGIEIQHQHSIVYKETRLDDIPLHIQGETPVLVD